MAHRIDNSCADTSRCRATGDDYCVDALPPQQVGIAGAEKGRRLRLAQDRFIRQWRQFGDDLADEGVLGQFGERRHLMDEHAIVAAVLGKHDPRKRNRQRASPRRRQQANRVRHRGLDIAAAKHRRIGEPINEIDNTKCGPRSNPDRGAKGLRTVQSEIIVRHCENSCYRFIGLLRRGACSRSSMIGACTRAPKTCPPRFAAIRRATFCGQPDRAH